jgi:hypothetical protein
MGYRTMLWEEQEEGILQQQLALVFFSSQLRGNSYQRLSKSRAINGKRNTRLHLAAARNDND